MATTTLIDRLDALVEYYANGVKANFAEKLNISRQRFGMWYAREFVDYNSVATKFPEVSLEWLIRGNGDMLLSNIPACAREEEPNEPPRQQHEDEDIVLLREDNKNLREDNQSLRNENRELRATNKTLVEKLLGNV